MANTIAKAKTYIQDEQSLQRLFRSYAFTQDLAKEFKGKGNGTVCRIIHKNGRGL